MGTERGISVKKLIELDAAIKVTWKDTGYTDPLNVMTAIRDRLKTLPTVDAVPVRHGQWIIKDNPGTGWYRVTCSECGEDVTSTAPVIGFFPNCKVIWNFCPDCGAVMDGKDGDNHD